MMEVLAHVDKNDLLPPQLVIRALAHNSNVTLGVIKVIIFRFQNYLKNKLRTSVPFDPPIFRVQVHSSDAKEYFQCLTMVART